MIDTQNEATIILCADDTNLFVSGPVAGEVIHKANALLSTLSEWSSCNGLKINNKKSKAILFRTRGRQVSLCNKLLLDNVPIEIVNEHKVLGVVFNTVLNSTPHVDTCRNPWYQQQGAFSRCHHFFPENMKLQIYQALFASHIDYCKLV